MTDIIVDVVNVTLSVIAIVFSLVIIFRSEESLDLAAKLFLATSITLFIGSLLIINRYMIIVPREIGAFVFVASRSLALFFFCWGLYAILRMVTRKV